jgi:hypothetical protein
MDSVGSVGHEAQVVELDWQWDKTSSLLYLASANQSFGSEPGALSVGSRGGPNNTKQRRAKR